MWIVVLLLALAVVGTFAIGGVTAAVIGAARDRRRDAVFTVAPSPEDRVA